MKITSELAELIGIIIGDGNIYYNKKARVYYVEITGNSKKERQYFAYISHLFKNVLGKPGKIRIHQRGLRLRVYSKVFLDFLINDLGMDYGKGKYKKVQIPEKILNSKWRNTCIRGIFDTDGSYFLSKKSHRDDYPSVEISTGSQKLASQYFKY